MTGLLGLLAAFVLYLGLGAALLAIGRALAAGTQVARTETSLYASGERAPRPRIAPGYRPYIATLGFALLHLGVLLVSTASASPIAFVYLAGLGLVLLVLVGGET